MGSASAAVERGSFCYSTGRDVTVVVQMLVLVQSDQQMLVSCSVGCVGAEYRSLSSFSYIV